MTEACRVRYKCSGPCPGGWTLVYTIDEDTVFAEPLVYITACAQCLLSPGLHCWCAHSVCRALVYTIVCTWCLPTHGLYCCVHTVFAEPWSILLRAHGVYQTLVDTVVRIQCLPNPGPHCCVHTVFAKPLVYTVACTRCLLSLWPILLGAHGVYQILIYTVVCIRCLLNPWSILLGAYNVLLLGKPTGKATIPLCSWILF